MIPSGTRVARIKNNRVDVGIIKSSLKTGVKYPKQVYLYFVQWNGESTCEVCLREDFDLPLKV